MRSNECQWNANSYFSHINGSNKAECIHFIINHKNVIKVVHKTTKSVSNAKKTRLGNYFRELKNFYIE
jgi:hypothetical protein